jgi:threonine synthase
MQLYSTKNKSKLFSFKEAVLKGLPSDNGLFMPLEIPKLPNSFFEELPNLSFEEIAFQVSKTLLADSVEIETLRKIAYETVNFEAPTVNIHDNIHALELFHGPTLAFKDFGARFMARLMSHFMEGEHQKLHILVATSGDTGGAVGKGFLGVENIEVTILYPSGKVSDVQEKQLTTLGKNVRALEINGTFDDCQALVKTAFLDSDVNQHLKLTSANSINISRLIPQSFYYFEAYKQLRKQNNLPVVFSIPSGNFGNLCGGLFAWKMGLPVAQFVASTNSNRIFTDYVESGEFQPKPSVRTISNAMDVGNPSNFPRLTEVFGNQFPEIKGQISAYSYSDSETEKIMREIDQKHNYTLDPHGAVGYLGLQAYLKESGIEANGIFLETAHPAKFLDVVEPALNRKVDLPKPLAELMDKPKVAIQMENDFEEFKAFLMKL